MEVGQIYKISKFCDEKNVSLPVQLPLGYCSLDSGTPVLALYDLGGGLVSVLSPEGEKG